MMKFEYINENLQYSLNSPGLIHNNEYLIRIFIKPFHMMMDGNFAPGVILTDELIKEGFSVFRKKYITPAELEAKIQARLISKNPNNSRSLGCIGVALARTIRNITDRENNQVFHILDDASNEGGYSHAIIVCKKEYPKSELTDYKYQLRDIFKRYSSVDNIFIYEQEFESYS